MAYHGATFPRISMPLALGLLGETMRRLSRTLSGFLLLLVAGPAWAWAQFTQYTTPGGPEGRPADRKAQLEEAAAKARLRLGALRIAPEIELKDVAYVKNLLGSAGAATPSDFTATAGGGFRAYLHTGPRVIWSGYVLPQYVWWQKETGLRRLNGLYGAEVDGFWNRLTLRLGAASEAAQQILTAEVPRLTSARSEQLEGTIELRLTGATGVFVTASLNRIRVLANQHLDPLGAALAGLDRDEQVQRAGLRWRPGNWSIGLGVEHSDVNFVNHVAGAVDSSNSGTAPVLEVARARGRLSIQADVAQRSLTAKQGATFAKFDKTTGNVAVSYELTRSLEVFAYASSNLVYSLQPDYSYFDDVRHGASLHLRLAHNVGASVYGETGSLSYTAHVHNAPRRRDDLASYGGALTWNVRSVGIGLQGSRTRFGSNISGAGRTVTTLGLTVKFAAGRLATSPL
jgi:hypothetical protein